VGGGRNNYGVVIHTIDNSPALITKIKRFHNHPITQSIEEYFYATIRNSSEDLKKYTVELITTNRDKEFGFFTFIYTHGRKPQIQDLDRILEFERVLQDIKLDFINKNVDKGVRKYILSPNKVLTPISKKQNTKTVQNIISHSTKSIPNEKLSLGISILNKLINKTQIHKKLNIKKDLVLQHRDFGVHNSKINQHGKLLVFDWESYTLGIPGTDILNFIMSYTISFKFVESQLFSFLRKEKISNYNVVTCYLTLQYLNRLVNQPEGVRIEENWDLAIDYLRNSPLNG
jgi:hypothetical protein